MTSAPRFALDLVTSVVRNPGWFLGECRRKTTEVRARGNAQFKYGLRQTYHHHLDARFERLEVNLGGAFWVDYSKAMIVSRFCRLLNPTKVLEIGTYRGGMTYHIARNTPESCHIWTLDLPRHLLTPAMTEAMVESDVSLAKMAEAQVGDEWRQTPESRKVTQLWGDSSQFDFAGFGPFELVYVDGSHAEPWVARDTENAFRLLAPTGAILWDDCYWNDVLKVLGQNSRKQSIYLFEDGNTAGYLQINGKPVTLS